MSRIFPIVTGSFFFDFAFPDFANQSEDFGSYTHIYQVFSQPYGTKFTLRFNSISALQTRRILEFYDDMIGTVKTFSLPHELWRHPLTIRAQLEESLINCAFRFESPPKVNSDGYDNYNISLSLISDFDTVHPVFASPQFEKFSFNLLTQVDSPLIPFETKLDFYTDLKTRLIPDLQSYASSLGKDVDFSLLSLSSEDRFLDYSISFNPSYKKTLNFVVSTGATPYAKAPSDPPPPVSDFDLNTYNNLSSKYSPSFLDNYYLLLNLTSEPSLSGENLYFFSSLPNSQVQPLPSLADFLLPPTSLQYPFSGSNFEQLMSDQIDLL